MKWIRPTITKLMKDPADEIKRSLPIMALGYLSRELAKQQAAIIATTLLDTYRHQTEDTVSVVVEYEILEKGL